MSKYSEIQVGDVAELNHLITKEDVDQFVSLTGDDNKLHIDEEFARKTTFKKPVVHGMLGASFISTVIGTKIPGDGALWYSQSIDFLLPVRIGDELRIRAEVTKKIDKTCSIELKTEIFNQENQKVLRGLSKIQIVEQTAPKSEKVDHSKEKVGIIIGATGGIGRAIAIQLAKDGYKLVLHYNNNKDAAHMLEREISKNAENNKPLIVSGDITDRAAVKTITEKTIRRFGAITLLVNCSTAKIVNNSFDTLKWEQFQTHFDINIKGSYNLFQEILPIMAKNKYGKIIQFSTQAIEGVPTPDWIPYVTGKSALHGFTKALALEYAPKGVRINMISPGMTETDLISEIPEKSRLLIAAKTPLRQLAQTEDIAGVASFLASSKSDHITGETIRVNGGLSML